MNPLFLPSRQKESRSGLNKNKALKKYTGENKRDEKMEKSMPGDWFYNQTKEEEVWSSLEAQTSRSVESTSSQNPFAQLDESAHKIRQIIHTFEMTDQEFVLKLMDMLDDDPEMCDLDQQTMLMEARFSLQKLIDDHAGNSEAQSKMLDSLKYWFNVVQQDSNNGMETDIMKLTDNPTFDATQLAAFINKCAKENENTIETATSLHQTIIETLQSQIVTMQRMIRDKNSEIQRLRHSVELVSKNRRRKGKTSSRDLTNQLNVATRKIVDQDMKIRDLKQTLATGGPHDEEGEDDGGETFEYGIDPAILADRELEFDSKLRVLNETIATLKNELKVLREDLKVANFKAMQADSGLKQAERAKKNAEQTLSAERERFAQDEAALRKKLEEASGSSGQGVVFEGDVDRIRIDYEKKLADTKENLRIQMNSALDAADKRHQAQIKDLVSSIETKDSKKLLETMVAQQASINEEIRKDCNDRLKILQDQNKQRVNQLTRSYESKIKDMEKEMEYVKISSKEELQIALSKAKIQFEEEKRKAVGEAEDAAIEKGLMEKRKLAEKNAKLAGDLSKLLQERNALRALVEVTDNASVADQIEMHDVELEDSDMIDPIVIEEEVEKAKKEIREEYEALLRKQRRALEGSNEQSMNKLKESMERDFENMLREEKRRISMKLIEARDEMKEESPMLNEVITELSPETMQENLPPPQPMVPLKNFSELSEKYHELLDQNSFLKSTLENMNKGRVDGDIVAAMQKTLNDEIVKVADVLKENQLLKEKVAAAEGSSVQQLSTELKTNRGQKAILAMIITQMYERIENRYKLLMKEGESTEKFDIRSDLRVSNPSFESSVRNIEVDLKVSSSRSTVDSMEQQKAPLKTDNSLEVFDINEDNSSKMNDGAVSIPTRPSHSFKISSPQNEVDENAQSDRSELEKNLGSIAISPSKERIELSHAESHELIAISEKQSGQSSKVVSTVVSSMPSQRNTSRDVITYETEYWPLFEISPKLTEKKEIKKQISVGESIGIPLGKLPSMSQQIFNLNASKDIQKPVVRSPSLFDLDEEKGHKVMSGFPGRDGVLLQKPPESDESDNEMHGMNSGNAIVATSSFVNQDTLSLGEREAKIIIEEEPIHTTVQSLYHLPKLESTTSSVFEIKPSEISLVYSDSVINTINPSIEINIDKEQRGAFKKVSTILYQPELSISSNTTEISLYNGITNIEAGEECLIPLVQTKNSDVVFSKNRIEISSPSTLQLLKPIQLDKKEFGVIDISPIGDLSSQNQELRETICSLEQQLSLMKRRNADPEQVKREFNYHGAIAERGLRIVRQTFFVDIALKDSALNENTNKLQSKQKHIEIPRKSLTDTSAFAEEVDEEMQKEQAMFCPDSIHTGSTADVGKNMSVPENVSIIRERQNLLLEQSEDIKHAVNDLEARHREVVTALRKALDMALGSLKTVGSDHPETLIEKLQEQAAYLSDVVMERENLVMSNLEQQNIINRRSVELIDLQDNCSQAESKIRNLEADNQKLMKELAVARIAAAPEGASLEAVEAAKEEINRLHQEELDEMDVRLRTMELTLQKMDRIKVQQEDTIRKLESELAIKEASKGSFAGITVNPFVIFSTSDDSLPKGGFSLSPMLDFEIEALPIEGVKASVIMDAVGTSPFESYREIQYSPPINENSEDNDTPYIDNEADGDEKQGRPSAIKKPRLAIPKPPSGIRQSIKQPLPKLKRVSSEKSTLKRTRSFDKLIPEFDKDRTVVYVTRYMKVPSENNSQRSSRIEAVKSGRSTARGTGRSDDSTTSAQNHLTVSATQVMQKTVRTNTSPLTVLKNRIEALESILQNKSNQVISAKDKEHMLQQMLYRLTNDYKKMEREYLKQATLTQQYQEKVSAGLQMIQSLTVENDELRALLKAYEEREARQLRIEAKGDAEQVVIEELRRRRAIYAAKSGETPEGRDFLARQAAAAARWARKREAMQEREKRRMLTVLQATKLARPAGGLTALKSVPISVKAVRSHEDEVAEKERAERERKERRERMRAMANTPVGEEMPSYEDALKMANAHNQRVDRQLRRGVIANPLDT